MLHGWIQYKEGSRSEAQENLERLNIRVGQWCDKCSHFGDCWVPEKALDRLSGIPGRFVWGLSDTPDPNRSELIMYQTGDPFRSTALDLYAERAKLLLGEAERGLRIKVELLGFNQTK